MQITAGTSWFTGLYQIVSVSAGAATLDRGCGSSATVTAGTYAVGGALATFSKLASAMVSSNKAFVKGSTFTSTATNTFGQSSAAVGPTTAYSRIIGYTSVRVDGCMATLTLQTNSSLTALSFTNGGWYVENLIVDCANLTTSTALKFNAANCVVRNSVFKNSKSHGVQLAVAPSTIIDCEASGNSGSEAIFLGGNSIAIRCYSHDNTQAGISGNGQCVIWDCLVTNNTGASTDGIAVTNRCTVMNCTVYGSGRDGISNSGTLTDDFNVRNNILANNGRFGLSSLSGAGMPAAPMYDGNAYFSNTSGNRSNLDDVGGTNVINGVAPYTNVLDVILSVSPFVNAAGGDFTLNNVAGGGAACRGAGTPGPFVGVSQVGKLDMGCFQHFDSNYIPVNKPPRIINVGKSFVRPRTVVLPRVTEIIRSQSRIIYSNRNYPRPRTVVVPGASRPLPINKPGRVMPGKTIVRPRSVSIPQPVVTQFVPFSRPPRQVRIRDSSYRRPQSAAVLALFPIVITTRREVR